MRCPIGSEACSWWKIPGPRGLGCHLRIRTFHWERPPCPWNDNADSCSGCSCDLGCIRAHAVGAIAGPSRGLLVRDISGSLAVGSYCSRSISRTRHDIESWDRTPFHRRRLSDLYLCRETLPLQQALYLGTTDMGSRADRRRCDGLWNNNLCICHPFNRQSED